MQLERHTYAPVCRRTGFGLCGYVSVTVYRYPIFALRRLAVVAEGGSPSHWYHRIPLRYLAIPPLSQRHIIARARHTLVPVYRRRRTARRPGRTHDGARRGAPLERPLVFGPLRDRRTRRCAGSILLGGGCAPCAASSFKPQRLLARSRLRRGERGCGHTGRGVSQATSAVDTGACPLDFTHALALACPHPQPLPGHYSRFALGQFSRHGRLSTGLCSHNLITDSNSLPNR